MEPGEGRGRYSDHGCLPPARRATVRRGAAVEEYLLEGRRLRFKALRVIHGRGIGVQRETVRRILGARNFVAGFRDAPGEAGGWGAIIVTLR